MKSDGNIMTQLGALCFIVLLTAGLLASKKNEQDLFTFLLNQGVHPIVQGFLDSNESLQLTMLASPIIGDGDLTLADCTSNDPEERAMCTITVIDQFLDVGIADIDLVLTELINKQAPKTQNPVGKDYNINYHLKYTQYYSGVRVSPRAVLVNIEMGKIVTLSISILKSIDADSLVPQRPLGDIEEFISSSVKYVGGGGENCEIDLVLALLKDPNSANTITQLLCYEVTLGTEIRASFLLSADDFKLVNSDSMINVNAPAWQFPPTGK